MNKSRTFKETDKRHSSTRELSSYRRNAKIQTINGHFETYHNPKKDILLTIADIVNTLEQDRDLLQNMTFDTTRVSQSASCVRISLYKINYRFEKLH